MTEYRAEDFEVTFNGQKIEGFSAISLEEMQSKTEKRIRLRGPLSFEFQLDGPNAEEFQKAFDVAPTFEQLKWGRSFLRRVIQQVGPRVTRKWLHGFSNGELGHPATEAWAVTYFWWQKREHRRLRQLRKKRQGWA